MPLNPNSRIWSRAKRRQQANRALTRQLDYQKQKAAAIHGHEPKLIAQMMAASVAVREKLARFRPIPNDARVLEVGSGAHGLIFFFEANVGVGIDPLAVHYATLFPAWQRQAPVVAATGETLPFGDASFDVVLCDNVVDHAESPEQIVAEITRVLAPSGLLYFTVNVHHPIYALVSSLHATWNALGFRYEIRPFADHTVHLTPATARRLFRDLPVYMLQEGRVRAQRAASKGVEGILKRIFFKNSLYEVIAERK